MAKSQQTSSFNQKEVEKTCEEENNEPKHYWPNQQSPSKLMITSYAFVPEGRIGQKEQGPKKRI
jgi:hypothetical protein